MKSMYPRDRGRFTRPALVSLSLGLVFLSGALVPVNSANASGQNAPGTAISTAGVLGVAPVVSGANLTVSLGASQALYQGESGQATSQSVNFGGLGALLTSMEVCGSVLLKPNQLPAPLIVDTNDGAKKANRSVNLVGSEKAAADPDPLSASAETSPVVINIPGILSVSGTSTVSTDFDAEDGRGTAKAESTLGLSLLGGLLKIDGLAWSATQTLDDSRKNSSEFSIGRVSVEAVPGAPSTAYTLVKPKTLSGLIDVLDGILAPLGITLTLPQESIDPNTKALSLTPLTVRISGSALERAVAKPVFDSIFKLETLLFDPLPKTFDCKQLPGLLRSLQGPADAVLTVLAGIAEGTGGANLLLGGVTVSTRAPEVFKDPFGGGDLPGGSTTGGSPPTTGGSSPTVAAPAVADAGSPVIGGGATPVVTDPVAPAAAVTRLLCRSQNPSGPGSCSRGHALVAGAAALLLGALLLGADMSYDRRGSRRTKRRAQL